MKRHYSNTPRPVPGTGDPDPHEAPFFFHFNFEEGHVREEAFCDALRANRINAIRQSGVVYIQRADDIDACNKMYDFLIGIRIPAITPSDILDRRARKDAYQDIGDAFYHHHTYYCDVDEFDRQWEWCVDNFDQDVTRFLSRMDVLNGAIFSFAEHSDAAFYRLTWQ